MGVYLCMFMVCGAFGVVHGVLVEVVDLPN